MMIDDEGFDPRGCRVVIALVVCTWIALGGLIWMLLS